MIPDGAEPYPTDHQLSKQHAQLSKDISPIQTQLGAIMRLIPHLNGVLVAKGKSSSQISPQYLEVPIPSLGCKISVPNHIYAV
jgi:hypothetical protein